eukprot:m.250543 g.250543  ORF g.250543 m.250543 type:complete len:1092 (-) comp26693_c2_seq14:8428-11703(-)
MKGKFLADAACASLGLATSLTFGRNFLGTNSSINGTAFTCTGDEGSLLQCSRQTQQCESLAFVTCLDTKAVVTESPSLIPEEEVDEWVDELADLDSDVITIDLRDNNITNVPKNVFSRFALATLLDASSNQISELEDESFAGLVSLRELYLASNALDEVPATVLKPLVSLNVLDLHGNQIQNIDNSFRGLFLLQSLDLSGNQIAAIAANALVGLTELEFLNLAHNSLDEIKQLPPQLSIVVANDNRLNTIPEALLSAKQLFLQANNISRVPDVSGLFAIAMQGNPSVCQPVVDLFPNYTQRVICSCAPGFYGISSCSPISEDFFPVPLLFSAQVPSVEITHPDIAEDAFPSPSIPEDSQGLQTPTPVEVSVTVADNSKNSNNNDTADKLSVFSSLVDSAFWRLTNAIGRAVVPVVTASVVTPSVRLVLNQKVSDEDFIPITPRMNLFVPTKPSFRFKNDAEAPPGVQVVTVGGFSAGLTGTPTSSGVFSPTIVAVEEYSGEEQEVAVLALSVQDCGVGTCNNGTCIDTESAFDGQFECDCDSGFTGDFCDIRIASSSSEDSVGLAVGLSLALFFLILLIACYFWWRWRHRQQKYDFRRKLAELEPGALGDTPDDGPKVPRELVRKSVTTLDELGSGAFGKVYRGLLDEYSTNGVPAYDVAIKTLKQGDLDEFMEEALLMAQIDHKHVVNIIGVCTVGTPVLLVLQFCSNGELKKYLEKHNDDIPQEQRILWMYHMALALEYLARKKLVHRDLAARNVLLDTAKAAKIADFGLARNIEESEKEYYKAHGGLIPVRWVSPEALESSRYSEASDVWAYGVTGYEIFSNGRLPYKGFTTSQVVSRVRAGGHLEQPKLCPLELYTEVLEKTWLPDALDRPTFSDIVILLRKHYEHLTAGEETDYRFVPNSPDPTNPNTPNDYIKFDQPTSSPTRSLSVKYIDFNAKPSEVPPTRETELKNGVPENYVDFNADPNHAPDHQPTAQDNQPPGQHFAGSKNPNPYKQVTASPTEQPHLYEEPVPCKPSMNEALYLEPVPVDSEKNVRNVNNNNSGSDTDVNNGYLVVSPTDPDLEASDHLDLNAGYLRDSSKTVEESSI